MDGQQQSAGKDIDVGLSHRRPTRQDAAYLDGVVATLAWVLGDLPGAPITRAQPHKLTTRDLMQECVHAEDVIDQVRNPWIVNRLSPREYGEGVKLTVTWLLGESIVLPVDQFGSRTN
jgi:hypothetical protein